MKGKKYISQSDLRVDNLKQFIKDRYNENSRSFYHDFKINLIKKLNFSEEQVESKKKLLRQAIGKYKNKTFSKSLQETVEKAFDLPKEILSQMRPRRSPAYIFISCTGESANIIFSEVKKNKIVDEISILFGDIDVFIKIYGTLEEVQMFITESIFKIKGISINNTKTYFSFREKNWMKYSVRNHPKYEPPSERWG